MNLKSLTILIVSILCLTIYTNAQSLISNGGFENGFTNWSNYASSGGVASYTVSTSTIHSGKQSMQINVSALATNTYSIQSINPTPSLTKGKQYLISFYAKSTVAGGMLRVVMQNSTYAERDFTLTNAWKKYVWVYSAGESNPQFKFHFISKGIINIDDISIVADAGPSKTDTLNIAPATKHQTMIGFGGAITWGCNRIINSSKQSEITNLLFNDLGADIIRFKNWYYPTNYPTDKTTNSIEGDGTTSNYWKQHLTATQKLHALAKAANPNVQTLLSSWNPPSNLKSNGKQEGLGGTLKKNANGFMYNEFGTYWNDVLNNIGFNPDYISMQNEPAFTTGWGSCEWRSTETSKYPSYAKAFDAVYNAIKGRANMPKLIGPETENITNIELDANEASSTSWNTSLNLFREMTNSVKSKTYLSAYAFHPYNFFSTPKNYTPSLLNMLKYEFNDKPMMMTEFSAGGYDWLQSADIIQSMLVDANVAAYIYWQMFWTSDNPNALIVFDDPTGTYKVTNQYYAMKHFAKYVDKGYKRIEVGNSNYQVKVSGFVSPTDDKITLVLLNNSAVAVTSNANIAGYTILSSQAYQSSGTTYFKNIGSLANNKTLVLPANSITTVVLSVSNNAVCAANVSAASATTFCAGGSVKLTANAGASYKWYNGTTQVAITQTYTATKSGSYTVEVTSVSGCKKTSAATVVTVKTLPVATITAPSSVFCADTSLKLTSSTGASYKWYNGTALVGTTSTYIAKVGGNYSVEVTGTNGCSQKSAVKTITKNDTCSTIPSATYSVTPSNNINYCMANGSTSIIQQNCNATTATQKWILVKQGNSSFYTVKNQSTGKFLTYNSLVVGSRLNANNTSSILWKLEFAGISNNGFDTYRIVPKADLDLAIYNKTATAINLFMGTRADIDNQKFIIKKSSNAVARLDEIASVENEEVLISCSPNPFQEEFTIKAKGEFNYTIYSSTGFEVEQGKGENEITLGENLSKGFYVIHVQFGNDSKLFKVIKE